MRDIIEIDHLRPAVFILHSFILKTHYETNILCRINIFHRTQKGVNWISIKMKKKHTYNKQFHSWSHEWNCKRKNVPLRILLFLCIIHDEQKHRISICIGGHLVWDALFFVSNRAALEWSKSVTFPHFAVFVGISKFNVTTDQTLFIN